MALHRIRRLLRQWIRTLTEVALLDRVQTVTMDRTSAESWDRALQRAARIARWRRLRGAGLALIAIPGAAQLINLSLWAMRSSRLEVVAAIILHLAAALFALGAPIRQQLDAAPSSDQLARMAGEYAARYSRLRSVRGLVASEAIIMAVIPPLRALLASTPLRWGVFAVVAAASLMVIWPLERIARAQRDESERLAGRFDS